MITAGDGQAGGVRPKRTGLRKPAIRRTSSRRKFAPLGDGGAVFTDTVRSLFGGSTAKAAASGQLSVPDTARAQSTSTDPAPTREPVRVTVHPVRDAVRTEPVAGETSQSIEDTNGPVKTTVD